MGMATPPTARGSYYLHTNKQSPFGLKFKSLGRYVEKIANKILHNTADEEQEIWCDKCLKIELVLNKWKKGGKQDILCNLQSWRLVLHE